VGAGLPPIPLGACYRLDNTELQQDFNSFLAEIRSDGTYQQIMDRWSNADDPAAMDIPQQRGTGRILRIATYPAMPPFNFINYGKPSGLEPELLTDKMLDDVMAQYRPITVRITHSEQSAVTALDFMVEKMTATPLSDSQRTELSNECRRVIEEPTKRGFRVKLII